MKKTILLMISILFVAPLYAGVIEMKDGVSGNAEILDTVGCRVTIRRKGNVIKLEKKMLSFIVMDTDTIRYNDFVCTPDLATRSSGLVFKNGYNVDKVNAIVGALPVREADVRQCTMYYVTEPINGKEFEACWDDKFAVFDSALNKKYPDAKPISREKLYLLLTERQDTNCVLLPFEVRFGYADHKRLVGDIDRKDIVVGFGGPAAAANAFGLPGASMMNSSSRAFVKATVTVKIIDLKSKSIVYNREAEFRENIPVIFKIKGKSIWEAKEKALEHALLNSLDGVREFFTKWFLQG